MANRVKQASATSFDTTTVTVNFSSATAGNLLMGFYALRGTFAGVSTPAGWTVVQVHSNNANTSSPELGVFYKVAAGGETSVTFTDAGASACNMMGVVDEWTGNTGAPPTDVSATSDSGLTAALSASSGTTAALAQANELCFAAWATRGAETTASFTNGFTQDALVTGSGNPTFPGSLIVAYSVVAATAAVESTCTWDASVRNVGTIGTFKITVPMQRPAVRLMQPMFRGSY